GLTGKVFGSFTNTYGWYLGLGLIMTFAALVMMEVITFDPVAIWDAFKRLIRHRSTRGVHHANLHQQHEMTLWGAFGLGVSSGFIAAPCTTPVLTSILAYIAKTQSVFLGMTLMLAFSAGLGTLLMLVAVFAGALQILPRSGAWLKTIKILSGLLLLGFADYLLLQAGRIGA
ncbi:MAG: cytochrome c biogenesis protein CcdA, partial [Bdellovibrionota bacterium]